MLVGIGDLVAEGRDILQEVVAMDGGPIKHVARRKLAVDECNLRLQNG